ncbi:MAG: thioredoxin family protein [Planctomycetota bacterium]
MQVSQVLVTTARRSILTLFLALLAVAARAETRWLTEYSAALAAAEETGRPILTVFTGSDWCQHCRTLEQNVLETETFRTWAEDRVILLMIDLPQQGISLDERKARSRICIKYGVRSFPSVVLVAPDGAAIANQAGYQGQAAETWVATLETRLPSQSVAAASRVHSSLDDAVVTARDAKRPILVMVSRPGDVGAKTRVASLMRDPEFESLARDNFVVAQLPPAGALAGSDDEAMDELLGDDELPPEAVEIVVTDDGHTPLFTESGELEPQVVVTGLRRFLAARQAARTTRR